MYVHNNSRSEVQQNKSLMKAGQKDKGKKDPINFEIHLVLGYNILMLMSLKKSALVWWLVFSSCFDASK